MAHIYFNFSGSFCPTSLPLFQGILPFSVLAVFMTISFHIKGKKLSFFYTKISAVVLITRFFEEHQIECVHPMVKVSRGDMPKLEQGQQDAEGGVLIARKHGCFILFVTKFELVIVIIYGFHKVVKSRKQMFDAFVLVLELPHQLID